MCGGRRLNGAGFESELFEPVELEVFVMDFLPRCAGIVGVCR